MFGEAAVILLVLVGGGWGVVAAINRSRRRAHLTSGEWEIMEHSDGEQLVLTVERLGDQPLLVGACAWGSENFEYEVEELRARAKQKVVALNSPRRRLGR